MKLYSTITGDRGKETGKGDNRQLSINLKIELDGQRLEIGNLILRHGEVGEGDHAGFTAYYYPINANCQDQKLNGERVLLYQKKSGI